MYPGARSDGSAGAAAASTPQRGAHQRPRGSGASGGSMKRTIAMLGSTLAVALLAQRAAGTIHLYEGEFGELEMSGFARVQADIHTAESNPNNPGLNRAVLQLFRQWLLTDTTWNTPVKDLRLFARTRVWFDTTSDADSNTPSYDAFPTRFRRDGWFMRTASDDVAAELWELWADYNPGDFWLRLGRQTIVWGDVAPTRLLDDINPLDLSWHVVLEPLGKEAFDNLRIPIWAARGAYSLPFAPDFQLEGYISPDAVAFVSTQLPARNPTKGLVGSQAPSPLNLINLPPFITLRDDIGNGQRGASGGLRFLGRVAGLDFTLNWVQRHIADGITVFKSFVPDPTSPIGGILNLKQVHPRFNTVGFSMNYFEALSKVVGRLEAIWDIDRPWENAPGQPNLGYIRRAQYGYAIAFDRPTFLLRKDRTANITVQFEQRIREGGIRCLGAAAQPVPQTAEQFTVLFSQPFQGFGGRYEEFFLDMAFLANFDNSFAFVPLVRYEPGNHWRFNLWYNSFFGDRNTTWGSQTWMQGVNISVSYNY